MKQRWMKNNRDPENIQYVLSNFSFSGATLGVEALLMEGPHNFGTAAKEHPKLLNNSAAYFLCWGDGGQRPFQYRTIR
jgi:hypothetical protein